MTVSQKHAKHVPERTCIACRQKRPKWELIRIVRTVTGGLEIDLRGKKTGRGAYLCKQQECWEIGLKKKKLAQALKSEIRADQRTELMEYSKTLPSAIREGGAIVVKSVVQEFVDEPES
jgi:predicted RNA-binding protein YlxR (DUF448 family)